MDLQRLISEVQARPAIWDQKNTHYHNRDIILRLWGEIAKACDVSSDVAKSKWKHLRDNFRNELKKTYRGKPPCDGGSPVSVPDHESKWVWFKSLQFLRDQMNSRVIGGCGHSQNGAGAFQTSLDETQIEPQIDIVEGDEEAHFDDLDGGDSCQSLMTSEEQALQQVGLPLRKRGKIGRKRILVDSMEAMEYQQGVERKRYESIQRRLSACQDEEDDTYHFLMSVRSPLRSLPLDRQMYVRLKIQEIILNELTALSQHSARCHDTGMVQDTKPHRGAIPGNSMLQNCSPERATDDNYFS